MEAEAVAAKGHGISTVATVTILVGLVTVAWMWLRKPKPKPPQSGEDEGEEFEEETPEHKDVPAEYMPEDGIFTEESLAPLDGKDLPLCMGVCGKVVNCSSSGSIRHGQGYGKLWAGRDATYSLATLSLQPEDASRRDFTLEDFDEEKKKALAGWYKHFTTKYPVIGRMKEYDGWDFSSIHELAKEQTPFGLKKDSETDEAEEEEGIASTAGPSPVTQSTASAEAPSDSQVFAKGDRVKLQNLDESTELNGQTGTLKDYNASEGKFVIRLEGTGETKLFEPKNLLVLK